MMIIVYPCIPRVTELGGRLLLPWRHCGVLAALGTQSLVTWPQEGYSVRGSSWPSFSLYCKFEVGCPRLLEMGGVFSLYKPTTTLQPKSQL